MSKYVYEQFVTPDQREKMTNDASGKMTRIYFAAAKLDPLTPEKRLNTLYSAIRDVEGDETHPIVQALQQHMEKSGVEASVIQDILTTAKKDHEEIAVSSARTQLPKPTKAVATNVDLPKPEKAVLVDGPELQNAVLVGRTELPKPMKAVLTNVDLPKPEKAVLVDGPELQNAVLVGRTELPKPMKAVLTNVDLPKPEKAVLVDGPELQNAVLVGRTELPKPMKAVLTNVDLPKPEKAVLVDGPEVLHVELTPEELRKKVIIAREEEEIVEAVETRPRSNALTGRDDPRAPKVKEIEAQDSIILGSTTEKGQSKVTALSSSEVDPITEAIRKEILAEQQKLIKTQIALSDPSVNAMDPQRFREYLTSDKGKEEAAKVFAKPEIQTALNKIEVEGYKKVHTEFSDSFKNVNWTPDQITSAGQPKTKTSEITNENGEVVAKIKETTHDIAPLAVTLDNGDKVNVKSYRTIDFPKELETGKGPLHLSMAVKDQNGRNISEKDAVYFTAHYDEQGKLTEISSPIPVKFMGKGDDAVGYIERVGPDGKPKVYTLPVTQGKYKEMMREVAKNKGMAVDLSQEVAQEAQDLALTKEKARVSPALERDEEAVQSKKKTERSEDSIALPEVEAPPLKIVLSTGMTAQEKTAAIDDMLRNVSPETIVATLKDQVAKGGSEAVGLIVEATKGDRVGDHRDVPKLTTEQFREVYETGMKAAKAIADVPAPSQSSKIQKQRMENIHSACNKLTKPANVDLGDHMHAKGLQQRNFELKNLPPRSR